MIKRMTMLAARRDRSHEEFSRYWRGKHADIARRLPQLGGYVQNHLGKRIDGIADDPGFRVDGVPELWFADEDAKTVAFQSDVAKMLPLDEPNFIDGITICAVAETVARAGTGPVKALLFLQSASKAGPHAGSDWLDTIGDALPGVRRLVVNRVLSSEGRPGVWHEPAPPSAIVELRFASAADAETALKGQSLKAALGAAPDKPKAIAYLADEHRIV